MADSARMAEQLDDLVKKVDLFSSREAIRDCLFRINRGMDRNDESLMLSGFHPDAELRWGTPEPMPIEQWTGIARAVLGSALRIQHLLGNILIEINGDKANVESYEVGHLTTTGHGETRDLIMACRYVDTFERRNGEWRISRRDKVTDWTKAMEAPESLWDKVALPAKRDESDVSVQTFGTKAFHSRTS